MKKVYLILFIFIILLVLFTKFRHKNQPVVVEKQKKEQVFLTAILVVKNEENIPKLISNFEKHKFINELIIWNNGVNPLKTFTSSKMNIRIINSPNDAKDLSQFIACSRANNAACYYQSINWNNQLINSLWNSYKRFPKSISVVSPPSMLWEHRRLSFYSRCKFFFFNSYIAIKLHTEFTWLNYGSIFGKSNSINFISQLGHVNIKYDDIISSEIFFSLWNNDFPIKLSNHIKPISYQNTENHQSLISGKTIDNLITNTIKNLYFELKKDSKIFSQHDLDPPLIQRDVRSGCLSDSCLFLTNLDSLPSQQSVTYTPRTLRDHTERFSSNFYPDRQFLHVYGYQNAVDQDPTTCWQSYLKPINGSYFGLDMFKSRKRSHVSLNLGIPTLWNDIIILISRDLSGWTRIEFDPEVSKGKGVIPLPPLAFRYIHVMMTKDSNIPFNVCNIEVQD